MVQHTREHDVADPPRILLFTGKGGVGKSTIAAGTAVQAARSGHRTLLLSTDAAHSLGDAFDAEIGADPTGVGRRLFVQQVDAQLRFEQSWAQIQRYLLTVLDAAGMDRVAAEELTVFPGAEEVFALLELRRQAQAGRWDVIVVDCAPTAETLRLLSLPDALGWYFDRMLLADRGLLRTLGPVLSRASGIPMPSDSVFDAVVRLRAELADVRARLIGPAASVRLVLTPERMVLAEARRSWTTLSLFGYRVDGVVANRVFPASGADTWRSGWVRAQDEVLGQVEESFAGLPVWRCEYGQAEPVGLTRLYDVARAAYGSDDPVAMPTGPEPFSIRRTTGGAVLRLALPLADSGRVDLARNADELVITVAPYRRLLTLPASLSRMRVTGARVRDGELAVRFVDADADAEDRAGASADAASPAGRHARGVPDRDADAAGSEADPPAVSAADEPARPGGTRRKRRR